MKVDGDSNTILQLFISHRPRLETTIFRLTGCRATATDLVQDLFLRLWGRPIGGGDEAVGYLFRSARNLAIDHLRAESTRKAFASARLPEQCSAEAASPEDVASAREEVNAVVHALESLPERVRNVFLLHRMHEKSYDQIARALNVSVSTVEKDMMRALAACRAHFAQNIESSKG